jgi:hypothetical protein
LIFIDTRTFSFVSEIEVDAPDLDAGHFDGIAFLEFAHGFEIRGDVIARLEVIRHADHFQNDHRHDHREREENAQPGFQCVSHNASVCCGLKSTVKNFAPTRHASAALPRAFPER